MRKINIANDARRDAEVAFGNKGHKETIVYKTTTGSTGRNERRLKATMPTTEAALLEAYGDALAEALVTGDPEVDMERIGLKLEGLKKVWFIR